MSDECALRLDIDKSYWWFKRNIGWWLQYWETILSSLEPPVEWLGYDHWASSSGHVHAALWIRSGYWCEPPQRYLLEAALGGDPARAWYNTMRFLKTGRDVDVLFYRKRVFPRARWPGEWFWEEEVG